MPTIVTHPAIALLYPWSGARLRRDSRPEARQRRAPHLAVFAFLFLCAISHPILDAMTDGGLGIAFFSPFSNERYFLPWRPIRVSPIGPRFFSARGMETMRSELVWVWIPLAAAALLGRTIQRYRRPGKTSNS